MESEKPSVILSYDRGFKVKGSAATYSPTQLPTQYHRR